MTAIRGAAFGVKFRLFCSSPAPPKAVTATVVARDHQPQTQSVFLVKVRIDCAQGTREK